MRGHGLLAALQLAIVLFVTSASTALADADVECRSQVPARVVPGCTERLKATNLTTAQRVSALQFRSWANTDLKNFEAAEDDVKRIFEIEPNGSAAYSARGRLNHFQGNNEQAEKDYGQAITLSQNKYVPHLNRGLFFVRIANHDAARADYEEAAKLDPKKAAPYLGRARVFRNTKRDDAALRDLNTAASLEPELSQTYLDRGELHLAMQQPRLALLDFEKALAQLKTSSRATRGRESALAMLSATGEKNSETVQPATVVAPVQPTSPSLPSQPAAPTKAAPAQAAPLQAPSVPTKPPTTPAQPASPAASPSPPVTATPAKPTAPLVSPTDALLAEAMKLRDLNREKDALVIYDKILAAEPGNLRAMIGKASTLEDLGDFRDAYKLYEAVTKLKPPQPALVIAMEGLARIPARTGQHEEAVAMAGQVLKIEPNSEEALFWRAFANIRLGKPVEALRDLRRQDETRLRVAAWMSYALVSVGDVDKAKSLADLATKANAKWALPFVTRARVALAKGDISTAETELRGASELAKMPEITQTSQLILLTKLLQPTDKALVAKRN
jgi:tetratricopeptide (TPR) repeat protein